MKYFPKEIIRFSIENHYSKFSRHSKVIYLLVIGMILAVLIALPFVKVDITIQSRGIIRSQAEPTSIQAPVTGQVQKIYLRENMKVAIGDTLICLAPKKIDDQLQMLDDKIDLYSVYIHDLDNLVSGQNKAIQSNLLKSSYAEYTYISIQNRTPIVDR
ncbi:MAG: biotin/lipoyl-binding protein [Bacteroidota bacterium]|nr:biotin/lipoyl-binding protein [Bacteroidota bacterium]MDO9613851.1 biotin/lipoyl-binding protein [Bacteroidota bacterium]